MSIEVTQVRRLRVYTEPSNAFGTDHTGTLNDFTDVPAVEGSIENSLNAPELDPETSQQHIDEQPEFVFGPRDGTLAFSMNLAPTGTAAGVGTTAVQGPLGEILAAVLGGETLSTGVTASSTSLGRTTFDATVTGNSIYPGGCVGVSIGSGYHLREIESVTGTKVTLKQQLPSAMTTGKTAHGCATYYLDQDPDTSLQFILEGEEAQDRFVLLGCQLESLSMETPIGELPRVTFSFQAADWKHESDAAGSFASTLGDASYTNTHFIAAEGPYTLPTVGVSTLTGSTQTIPSITWNWQLAYTAVRSTGGVNTKARFRRTRNKPHLRVGHAQYYQDTTFLDARDNKTKKAHFWQIGTEKGKSILLSVPTTQVVQVQRADQDGLVAQNVTFHARNDQDTAGASTTNVDRAQSIARIHLG